MGIIKDRNGKDLVEAEEIKKRWKKYTKELGRKVLNNLDNHDGVVSHSEPDILECEVKWASGSTTASKASGADGIPAELFEILKNDAVKVLHSISQQIWKPSSGHRTGEEQSSSQFPRRTVVLQTTGQLHSSFMLVRLCSKSSKLGFSIM